MHLWWVSRGKTIWRPLVTTHLKDAGKEFEAEEFRGEISPRRAGAGGGGGGLVLLRGTIRNDDGESPSY